MIKEATQRIRTDRRYTLGEYKHMTLEDEITINSSDNVFDAEFNARVRLLQLVTFEIVYRKYALLISKFPHSMDLEHAVEALEEIREEELLKLKAITNGKSQDINLDTILI